MVEFCTSCGTSLPKGDLTVKSGKIFTSHDYDCPSCGKTANPAKENASGEAVDPDPDREIVFKKGTVTSE
jgi:uncharacterized Zn finger protein (UPF0148 family)